MRVLLLVNATHVVGHRAQAIDAAEVVLRAPRRRGRGDVARRGHATRLAHAAAHDDFDVVAVLGGDGTLNEAAEGLLNSSTALAPLPGGSTNVYARTLGYPNDARRAAEMVLASLRRDATKRIGVGVANRRPFLCNTGIGFDAAVVRRVERHPKLKRMASHPVHVGAAVAAFFAGDGRRTRFDVETDTGETIEGVRFAIVSKADPYTFLGARPLRVAPDAGLERPLAITAFRSLDLLTLVGGAASAMGSGDFLAHRRGVEHRSDLHHIIARSAEPFAYQVDGDDIGDTPQLDLTFEPDALTIVIP